MRYLCLNCENRFELEDGDKPRCPKCMRATGIEPIAKEATAPARSAPVGWIVAAVVAVLIGGFAVWRARAPEQVSDTVASAPLALSTLRAHLRRTNVDAASLDTLLEADPALRTFAEQHASGTEPQAIATSLYEAIRARASAQAFVRWSLGIPRDTPPATATEAWSWLAEDGARRHLYPLEAASILVAMLRTRGVNAMLAEVFRFPGDGAPPDPSGHFGYYVAAVYPGAVGEGTPHYYDVWAGHETQPEEGDVHVLTDLEAIGAALDLRAIQLVVHENDAERALTVSSHALRLHPRSPTVRSVRGAILLAAGNANEALAEFQAANQLRSDGPRRNLIAGLKLAEGDLDAARREVSAALEEFPDYANAHATLAALHMADAAPEEAEGELAEARRLDPELHLLPGLYANFYASQGDFDRAIQEVERALRDRPDTQTHLLAARLFRQASRFSDMRREAQAAVQSAPAAQRDQVRALAERMLGEGVFEDPLADDDEALDDELDEGGAPLQLGGGSFQLSSPTLGGADHEHEDEDEAADDEAADEEEGPALMLGDPSSYRLGGGGNDLELRLQ